MPQEDKSISSNSRPGKPTGSSPAPTQAPSTNSGHVTSTSSEQDLRESEERLRAIVNQVIVGIVQADLAGQITFVNDRYCEITGYPREELLGKRWQDLTHPDHLPHNIELFERMAREGNPFTFEKRYKRKNGETVCVDIGASLLRNAGGQVFGR
jgi:PAS domain S-box-containing protein